MPPFMLTKRCTMKIQNLTGTRDFYPKNMRILNYIFSVWRKAAEKYGYEEVDAPMLEPAELWRAKSGGELPEQMYNFKDKGDREVAIRPEFTPSLARMVAQKQKELPKPLRWYSMPRCWRYERPQSGRLREFFQFNIDCLGTDSMKADAEIIAVTVDVLKQLGLTPREAYVRISNRKLLNELLKEIEIDPEQASKLIDKKDKITENEFEGLLKEEGLTDEQIFGLKDILNITDLRGLEKQRLSAEGKAALCELKELFSYLKMYGVEEFCEIDLSIIRGLDYYTKTVFEVFDRQKKFRAIAGGGRYDDLVADFGGERCPGVGLGMGDVVLAKFLEEKNKLPNINKKVEYYVAPISESVMEKAMELAQKLRRKFNVEMDITGRALAKQMDYANSAGAKKVLIVGEKDLKNGQVTVKDMATGKDEKLDLKSL